MWPTPLPPIITSSGKMDTEIMAVVPFVVEKSSDFMDYDKLTYQMTKEAIY